MIPYILIGIAAAFVVAIGIAVWIAKAAERPEDNERRTWKVEDWTNVNEKKPPTL